MDMEYMLSRTVGEVFELGPGIPIFLYDKDQEPHFIPVELCRFGASERFLMCWITTGKQKMTKSVDSSFRVWVSSKHLPNPANPEL